MARPAPSVDKFSLSPDTDDMARPAPSVDQFSLSLTLMTWPDLPHLLTSSLSVWTLMTWPDLPHLLTSFSLSLTLMTWPDLPRLLISSLSVRHSIEQVKQCPTILCTLHVIPAQSGAQLKAGLRGTKHQWSSSISSTDTMIQHFYTNQ